MPGREDTAERPGLSGEVLAHATWLRRLAGHLVRDDDLADDLVQDTWLAATRNPPNPERRTKPWLAQVLRNFVRMRFRGARSEAARYERVAAEASQNAPLSSAEALLGRHEMLRLLARLIAELDEPYRSTVLLWSEEDLSPTDIARRQHVPAGTVRWRLKHALESLRRELDRQHGGDRRAWSVVLTPIAIRDIGQGSAGWSIAKGFLAMSIKTTVVVGVVGAGVALWSMRQGPSSKRPVQVVTTSVQSHDRSPSLAKDLRRDERHRLPSTSSAPYRGEVPFPSALQQFARSRTLWGQFVQAIGWLAGEEPQTLGAIYEDEARHVEWAQAMESLLRQRFVAAEIEDVVVDCRQSTCQIDLEHPIAKDLETQSANPYWRLVRTTGPLAWAFSSRSAITEGPAGRIQHLQMFIAFSDAEIDPNKYLAWVHQAHQDWTATESERGR